MSEKDTSSPISLGHVVEVDVVPLLERNIHPAVLVASGFFGGLALCWLVRSLAESGEKTQAMRQLGRTP